jgi:2,4-dienoyl-CoA reductase-like NADH-dependent reductase (Old Yellow Enzyme family)
MSRHFQYKTLTELQQSSEQLGAEHVRFEHNPQRVKELLSRKVQVGDFEVGNSLCIQPMEGCDCDTEGHPGPLVWRRYERFGRGGAKLIWVEATAVVPEGRANTRQLMINESTVGEIAQLLELIRRVHREEFGTDSDLYAPLQLTHSGRYSVPDRIIAYHNPLIDAKTNTPADYPIISDDELERLEEKYVEAARLAYRAGYTAVDVKATHGYLINELLGARTRPGRYGGSLENRARFLLNICNRIGSEFGSKMTITVRLGCFDSVPYLKGSDNGKGEPYAFQRPYDYGFGVNTSNPLEEDLREVKTVIGWLKDAGCKLLNVSMGSPYYNPHVTRPFEKPDEGNYEEPEHPLLGVNRHFRIAGELQRTFPDLPMVGSGYSWLQIYAINAGARNIDEGNIRFVGIGRNSLAYPEFGRDAVEKGVLEELRVCKTLTFCTYLMRQKTHPLGQWETGCPPFDKSVYGSVIKAAREAKRTAKT